MQGLILRNEQDTKDVGRKIRERRKALGMSQDDLADRMGSSKNDIWRHENGKNDMSVCTLFRYAEALEVNPAEFIPDRFREKEKTGQEAILTEAITHLSEKSRQTLISIVLRMQELENMAAG